MIKFSEIEKDILASWKKENLLVKVEKKEAPKGEFVFYDGPPTANGKPGIHHVLARTFKDVVLRFRTMQGYRVTRKAGWDTHGLPVEIAVEKELGISGKKDIENLVAGDTEASIIKFNTLCKESVWKFKTNWEAMTERMGYLIDMEHPYITYENEYIESIWSVVHEIHKKGLLYKGFKVVPYCPRDQVTLSSHEVAQGYQDVYDTAVYVKFALTGESKKKLGFKEIDAVYFLAWTTTPWTLFGNVALAVGEKINYSFVQVGDEMVILAKELIEKIYSDQEYQIIKDVKGSDLLDLSYVPLYPVVDTSKSRQAYVVVPADFVTTTDGTGIVHTAVVYGEDDYQLGLAHGLPQFHTVDLGGKFVLNIFGTDNSQKELITSLNGKFVKNKEAEGAIIDNLSTRGLLLRKESYKHNYPHCWRCGTPLLYYAKPSWFIRMSALSEKMVSLNKGINWVPDYIQEGRFGEWLRGVKDWAISRERYWGTPLPIWECNNQDCGHIKVVGSVSDLPTKLDDLHKPFIDHVEFPCDMCGGVMKRVPEVMDVWFDSGTMPYAQHHHVFGNTKSALREYPADYICEAIDQTRGWFYTLLAIATLLDLPAPFKNVICLGHINDKHGKKMSKSKGNVVDPEVVFEQYGADAVRLYMCTMNQPGDTKNFDEKGIDLIIKKVFLIWLNVVTYYETYKKDGGTVAGTGNVLDLWVIAKLNTLNTSVRESMESYDIFRAARLCMDFVDILSTWYVRRSRERTKGEEMDQQAFSATLKHVLLDLARITAPFIPFLSDYFYRRVTQTENSVHLASWPEIVKIADAGEVEREMDQARRAIEIGLALRSEAGVKIRQPLEFFIINKDLSPAYRTIIAEELNVERVDDGVVKASQEVIVKEEGDLIAGLNCIISDELRIKGLARELTRKINEYRKQLGLTINDRIGLLYSTDDTSIIQAITEYQESLCIDTRCISITKGEGGAQGGVLDINGVECKVSIVQ